jgi:hypothetical protein
MSKTYQPHSLLIIKIGTVVILLIGVVFWLILDEVMLANNKVVIAFFVGYSVFMLLLIWWGRWFMDQKKTANIIR